MWKNLGRLATVEFWDCALARALRSFLQGCLVGFSGGLANAYTLDWKTTLLTGALMAVASILTSMIAVLPEEKAESPAGE